MIRLVIIMKFFLFITLIPFLSSASIDPNAGMETSASLLNEGSTGALIPVPLLIQGGESSFGESFSSECWIGDTNINLCGDGDDSGIDFGDAAADGSCEEGQVLSGSCCYSVGELQLDERDKCLHGEPIYTCLNGSGHVKCPQEEGVEIDPDQVPAPESFTPTKADCRNANYSLGSNMDCSGIKNIDDAIRAHMQSEAAAKQQSCTSHISTAVETHCKTVAVQTTQTRSDTSTSIREMSCNNVENLKTALSQAQAQAQTCKSSLDACPSACNISPRAPENYFVSLKNELSDNRSPECESHIQPAYSAIERSVQSVASSSSAEENRCASLADEGGDNQGQGVNPSGGGSGGNFSGGGSTNLGELGSTVEAAVNIGKALKNTFGRSSNNGGGSSLDLSTNGLGSATAGMDDEAVFPGSNRGTYNKGTSGSTGGGSAGGAKTTSAKALSSGASKVAAQAKKRRSQSAKARNLINGYKNVRASDGGGSLSIKPADFKKHGSKALKAKLAEARKKHGKGLPLIFKNGKFVLDFLAMKDSKRFKARNAAMSDRLKGTSRKTASVADLHVHQNPRLNIFKIMNFRYQRQKFTQEL